LTVVAGVLISAGLLLVSDASANSQYHTGTGTWYWQNPLPQGNDLEAVACPSAALCYGVGQSGAILATTDSGVTWTAQPSGTNTLLHGVSCPSASTCYSVGNSGIIRVTTNSGASWPAQASGTTNNLFGVTCPSTSQCYVVGGGGTILTTTNSGAVALPRCLAWQGGRAEISSPHINRMPLAWRVCGGPGTTPTLSAAHSH